MRTLLTMLWTLPGGAGLTNVRDRVTPILSKSGAGSGGKRPSLSAFDDCPRGGSFYITIIDHGRRGGTLRRWTVYLDKPEVRTDS